jgi:hypothetical protein
MMRRDLCLALLPMLALASGCAQSQSEYPSLAIRAAEITATRTVAAPQPAPPAAPPRATLARLGPLAADARAAHAAFLAAADETLTRVRAADGDTGLGESRALAEVALADLSTRRSVAMVALADLDRLYVDALTSGESAAEIAPVRDAIAALVAEEDRVLATLAAQLAR